MYKFTSNITNSHLILVRKKLSDGSCAALVVMRAPIRRYAENAFKETCPNPANKPKSRKFLYGAVGATLAAGAAIVYAKHSPNTRNWLDTNMPWANNVVAVVYQENTTYYQFTANQIYKLSSAIRDFLFGKEGVPPLDFKQRSEQKLEEEAKIGFQSKTYDLPPMTLEPLYVEEIETGQAEVELESMLVQTDKCEPAPPPKILVTKTVVELEQEMHENTKIAIDNYKEALKLCEKYNSVLFRIVETPLPDTDKRLFTSFKALRSDRDKAIAKAGAAATKAKCALKSISQMISDKDILAPMENITQTKRYIREFTRDLLAIEDAVLKEVDRSNIADKFWDLVEAARLQYKEELETLFPNLDLCERRLDIKGETDLLLLYTINQIQYLQNEIAEMQTIRDHKITKAIECMDEKQLIDVKVEDMIKKERIAKDMEFQKKALQISADAQVKLKEELRKQYDYLEDIARARLAKKEAEIMGRFHRQVSELVEKERVIFKKELAAMAGKLQAIEQTLKQRAAAEAEARRSQSMWAAAEALLAATRRPAPETVIMNEVQALEKAGQNDKLVQTVLKGISDDVRQKGITTEKALRDRFDTLEQRAMKVALIGREGASLPMYFLSWLQSKMIFQKLAEIPKDELDNLPTDFTNLDTFDIIQRARYHMDHGDLSAALRYVNLLQGAPRAAAACWAEAARRHLEVRQAAETVMAHASLSGMLYL